MFSLIKWTNNETRNLVTIIHIRVQNVQNQHNNTVSRTIVIILILNEIAIERSVLVEINIKHLNQTN